MTKKSIVGGGVSYDPADRVAARLVQKAPWWAYPPEGVEQPVEPWIKPTRASVIKQVLKENIDNTALSIAAGQRTKRCKNSPFAYERNVVEKMVGPLTPNTADKEDIVKHTADKEDIVKHTPLSFSPTGKLEINQPTASDESDEEIIKISSYTYCRKT